ncbi:IS5 family transposase [Agrobacterium vitis]|uniref:IS5 family transposase n=3 Tax=Agrobacterium vitis TaxID=373 RepID=A0A368NPD1_AGRVI|nr:IS5 family transposase [Agrobacterium vitis]KAA3500454.1 IS5 family transposase [Agrobacterium vitis]KAA3517399.1 IS5 family transposase [Agrobacterium vitis]MCF1480508.1 IS5 family transposase [Agrobacterium vitis]MVA32900.1 IS5 family transposase [Agrobacterium vitis]NOJ37582.1 IS5 family transposase [Agrobacterium vitis]
MPHKHNASRRHHIGKMKFKVTNWAEYEAGLRRRGSLTLWITPDALAGWAAPRRRTRGGQPLYSDLAIETTLMLGMVFGLRLRQSEGLLSSVLDMMGLDLPVPDHTTLSRRARTWKPSARGNDRPHVADGPIHVLVDSTGLKVYGAGQWLEEKHGVKSRRSWRKLHLAVDADSGEIIAHSLTDQETGDASQLEPLLDQINNEIDQFTADGAYDGAPSYDVVLRHSPGARVVIPPRSNAVEKPNAQASCQRHDHIASVQIDGQLKWQASTGYGKRALVETAMGRYKGVIGQRMRARSFLAQQTEAAIGVALLNRMLACGRPKSVRCRASAGAAK